MILAFILKYPKNHFCVSCNRSFLFSLFSSQGLLVGLDYRGVNALNARVSYRGACDLKLHGIHFKNACTNAERCDSERASFNLRADGNLPESHLSVNWEIAETAESFALDNPKPAEISHVRSWTEHMRFGRVVMWKRTVRFECDRMKLPQGCMLRWEFSPVWIGGSVSRQISVWIDHPDRGYARIIPPVV